MLVDSLGIGCGPVTEEVGGKTRWTVTTLIVGSECAQLHLNFTVQKHWDIMCLFVHFFYLKDEFYVQGFNGTDIWSDFKQYVTLWYASLCSLFFLSISLVPQCSCFLFKSTTKTTKDRLLAWIEGKIITSSTVQNARLFH